MIPALRRLSEMTEQEWHEHDERIQAERAAQEAQAAKEAEARLLAQLGLPERVLEVLRGAFVETDATRATAGSWLLLCLSGNPGNGKTVAAARWLLERRGGLFLKAAELARWDRYDAAKMRLLLRAPSLVVDDLGTEYQDKSGNFMALFDELVDYRYDHRLATVLTTNLAKDDFALRYGERVIDRMREAGRFYSVGAKSMRGRP